ncbi:MAG: DUF3795 domain-containing protein [Lachnospiraceae bacterium]|nr:DUF3795 domain-containing protein [Lachnospiraceae bacterium]
MEYKLREYPLFSACGLNCGLCPRYHTVGTSRCPGCAGEGFSEVHPPCGMLSCCQRKGLEYCFECGEFPCKKYNDADSGDSFITQKNQFIDMEKAKQIGMEAYKAELDAKVKILTWLLANCNDGRRKSFFCVAVNLLELQDIQVVFEKIVAIEAETPVKEKAKTSAIMFEEIAEKRNVSLKLRRG